MRGLIAGLLIVASVVSTAKSGPMDEIPAAFEPFEALIGGWKGMASTTSNKVKGWPESHNWAWKFEKGKAIGLSLTLEGDKTLTSGVIRYDDVAKKYKLDGVDPAGKPIRFLGSVNPDGKTITFDRVGASPEGKERLVVRPASNKIRYTFQLDRQEPGAPQYKSVISFGLTRDGEAFAAGGVGGGADLPKCIMTGGAANITVSYMGKSYPVCCTGCRDEFNDNPAKYARIADLAAQAGPKDQSSAKPAANAKGKDDGSFDGLIEDSKPKAKGGAIPPKAKADEPSVDESAARSKDGKAKDDGPARAARELQLGQNLEKGGKKASALEHYRKVVKDHPGTESAKTAAARIKALEAK